MTDRSTILRDYPYFEKLMIFDYCGEDTPQKTMDLAELFKQNAIDFVAYNATNPDNIGNGFVIRKSGRKWKEIIAMINSVKPMQQLVEGKYYFKTIRFAIAEPEVKFAVGNLKECLESMYY